MNQSAQWMCDVQSGTCAPQSGTEIEEISVLKPAKVKMLYFTDPICSACWAIEPDLRKFKLAYGAYLEIEYKMGGLLPKWEGFADRANGISGPADVAGHWDEVGAATGMSIDGDIWLEDPLHSSYPPSIAFKAMQNQSDSVAVLFLRKLREMVFLQKKNITRLEHLLQAVEEAGGDKSLFLTDYQSKASEIAFLNDVQEGRSLGVRGFPTFVMISEDGKAYRLSGMGGYDQYVLALQKALGHEVPPAPISTDVMDQLNKFGYLSTREISVLINQDDKSVFDLLAHLEQQGKVKKETQKFGEFWRVKNLNQ